ncbi:MAG: non-ribosomal peptide synthetase [Ketobacteraceae bacterium]|nr:non-ribosomal peptide synthetase [Ketobacteraceae bacterium]
MTTRRPVTANERIYLAGKHAFSDIIIQLFVEGEGSITLPQLQDAVNHVAELFPGTRLRLQYNEWIADAAPPPVVLVDFIPDIDTHFQRAVELHGGMDPQGGHTCDVVLATDGTHSFVAFRALHAIMDGRGLELWAKAVFAALRGEIPPAADSMLADDEYAKAQKAPLRKDEPLMPHQSGPSANANSQDQFMFDYGHCSLRGNITGIVARLSIGIRTLLLKQPEDNGCVMVPVDLRQDMPAGARQSTANLSLPLFIPLQSQKTWQEFSSTMLTKLQDRRFLARGRSDWLYRLLPVGLLGRMLGMMWKRQTANGKYLMSAVVSHTGRQRLPDFSSGSFQAGRILFVPCAIPVAPLSIIITETESSTDICLVKGRCLWDNPDVLLAQLIDAAGLSAHVVERVQAPREKIAHATPLPPHERVVYPEAHLGLHQLFERQAESTPESVCVAFRGNLYTYREINARANRLAHYLIASGVHKGEFIGVGLERSVDLIVSILAVLKSGGAYLPLDPTLPPSRLEYMVKDSSARLVISRSDYASHFCSTNTLIFLDTRAQQIANLNYNNPGVYSAKEEDDQRPCYLIYTSGSTGNPKGTINTHQGVVNHFLYMQSRFGFGSDDATFQKTPISFDASLLEVFLPLFSGGRLVVTEPEGHKDARYLCEQIQSQGISFISIIPSVLNGLLDEMENDINDTVRLFLVGGELFSTALYHKVKSKFPKAAICNLYGPAEAAIDSLLFVDEEEFSGRGVPIGKPVANMEAFVVNEALQRVAQGEPGELIVAGLGVGLGYINRPELTAERFLDHPFRPELQVRAYRTGDVVRQLPNGDYEFLGRQDYQVKIQGVRIELGEIEHHIESIPEVKQTAVLQSDLHGHPGLVAYFTVHRGAGFDEDIKGRIRQALKKKLPLYMVPGKLIRLDKMPLSTNGKLDRLALSRFNPPEPNEPELQRQLTDREQQVASIWKDVLGEDVNFASDFFELGGNSMMAIRLVRKINESLGTNLHAQAIYENPAFSHFTRLIL